MILVTGATGNVGRRLVAQLAAGPHDLRVLSRDARKLPHLDSRIERVIGDLSDPRVVQDAVRGVDQIFLLTNFGEDHLLGAAVDACVRHVVFLSSVAPVETFIGRAHRYREQAIVKTGMAWTFLRAGAFMSNTLQWAESIRREARVYSPTGNGKMAPISPRDIARAAAVALTTPGHEGRIYEIVGPELLSVPEQVAILSDALGVHIACLDQSIDDAAARARAAGASPDWVDALVVMWTRIRNAGGALPSSPSPVIKGLALQRFADWCREHREAFVGGEQ